MPRVLMTAAEEARQYAAQQRLDEVTEQAERVRDSALHLVSRLSELADHYEFLHAVALDLIEDAGIDGRRRPVRPWPSELSEALRLAAKGCDRWTR